MTIKKITLATITAVTLLASSAQAQGQHCSSSENNKVACKAHHKAHGMGHKSPLLLNLPSPMRMLMHHTDDTKLALTAEQKTKLEAQRKEMMPKMMNLKKEIQALSKEVKSACKKNAPLSEQKVRLEKLAQLKTQATLTKLTCIEGVKAILSKTQKAYMKELRQGKKAKMKGMTCPSGKCDKK